MLPMVEHKLSTMCVNLTQQPLSNTKSL